VQVLGLVAGVLVIRSLTPEQYAYYTIAQAGLAAMTVLADSGVGNAVLAQGGAVWHDRARLGGVLATGLALRRRFAVPGGVAALALVWFLLRRHDAGALEALVVALAVLPIFVFTVTGQLLEIAVRLHQDVGALQRVHLAAAACRLGILAAVVSWWPFAAVATLAAAVPQALVNWRVRSLAARHADWRAAPDPEARGRILKQAARTLPSTIFYVLSGQLAIVLISIFGRTEAVAAVGALARLAVILGVLGTVFAMVGVPRFARIPATDGARIRRRYRQALALLALVAAVPLAGLAASPEPILVVLGPNYRGLADEAVLMGASSAVALLTGAAFSLGAARGVIVPAWLAIPCGVAIQGAAILLLPIDTAAGVILLGLLGESGLLLIHVAYFHWATRRDTPPPPAG
jgi:O-antigen/teichoic acid export membrane protein